MNITKIECGFARQLDGDLEQIVEVFRDFFENYGFDLYKSSRLFQAVHDYAFGLRVFYLASVNVRWESEDDSPTGNVYDTYHPTPFVAVAFELYERNAIDDEELSSIVDEWVDEMTGLCHCGVDYL